MHKSRLGIIFGVSLSLGLSVITFGLVKENNDNGIVVRDLTEDEILHPVYAQPFEVYDSLPKDNTKYKNGNQDCSMTLLDGSTSSPDQIEDVWNAYRGDGTTIAIIDTGIDYNHPDFKFADGTSKILDTSRYYYINNNQVTYNQYGVAGTTNYNFLDHGWDSSTNSLNSHGTNVASSAASAINGNGGTVGIAPNAKILALKTDMNLTSIYYAIQYAVDQGVDVINMSLGAYAESFVDGNGVSQTGYASTASYLTTVINNAYNKGIIVVAAAGNEKTTVNSYPACNTHVIGVGALASGSYSKASFSNYNPSTSTQSTVNVNVDLSAPGYVYQADETATYKNSTISNRTNTFKNTQGTSFASPIVAGAACLWKQKNPSGTPSQFESALYAACDDIGSTGWDTTFGHGALNIKKLLLDDSTSPTSVEVKAKDDKTTITNGEHVQLYHQVLPLNAADKSVTWSSSDSDIASVNSTSGVVTAGSKAGTVTITAKTSNNKTGTITFNNNSGIPVTDVSFVNHEITVDAESDGITSETFAYTVSPANASNPGVTFSSSNEEILSLDNNMWLSGQNGTAVITVTSDDNESIKDTCTVTVGSGGGGEQTEYVYKSCTFAKGNANNSTSGYTGNSGSYTSNGFQLDLTNYNNNSKGWDYIKIGGSGGAYTGTIKTHTAIDKAVSKINISVDSVNSSYVTTAKLYISDSQSTSGATAINVTLTSPMTSIVIPTGMMTAGKYYVLEIACSKANSNGVVQLSGISFFTGGTGGDTPEITLSSITVSSNARSFMKGETFRKETVTAHYSDNSSKIVSSATFSGYDMSNVGTQTITVSYTEGTTVTTTYEITVTESSGGGGDDEDIEEYYKTISDSLTDTQLLTSLRTLNLSMRTSTVGYGSMGTSTSGQFRYTDYDPSTVRYDSNGQPYGTKILSFYSGTSCTSFNREHVWPNSRGGGSGGSAGSPYPDQDIFMPRPTISSENSNRGNSKYVEGLESSSAGWDPVKAFGEANCYMGKGIRGECARIIFYCMTVNANLILDDTATGGTTGKTMGKLSDLLKWNLENPVNNREVNRQSGGQYLQGNRNAFVDHPEYACKIWGNYNSETQKICSSYEPPVEKSLESITVGNVHRSFTIGATFVGETITAHYSDGSKQTVTGSYSGYNMNTAGTQTVTASYTENGITLTVTYEITVTGTTVVSVTGVSLDFTSATLDVGETMTLTATVAPTNATNKSLTWSSNNTAVATVSTGGVVTAVSAGTATITVTTADGGKTATCSVTVKSSGGSDTELSVMFDFTTTTQRTTQTSNKNEWQTQGFTFTNNKGDSSNGCISNVNPIRMYKSSNATFTAPNGYLITSIVISGSSGDYALELTGSKNTCTVESSGTTFTLNPTNINGQSSVYFVLKQQARIYDATVYYKQSGVTPTPTPEVRSVSLSETQKAITTSESFTLTSTVVADQGADYTIEWSITEGTDVISLEEVVNRGTSASGESVRVVPLKAGSAKVQVSAGGESSVCDVTINSTLITSIVISGDTTIDVDGTGTLTANISPSTADNKTLEWSSSDSNIISVDSLGNIKAHGTAGQKATITATATDGSNVSDSIEITIKTAAATISKIELDVDSSGKVPFGKYRSPSDILVKVTYSDSSYILTNEATINAGSVNSLIMIGSVSINASYGGKSITKSIFITNEGSGDYVGWSEQKMAPKADGDGEVTFNATPQEQAEAWSEYFIKQTGGRDYSGPCKAGNPEARLSGLQSVWTDLSNEYSYMVGASKNEFCSNTTSSVISEARNHYSYIAKTYSPLTQFVVNSDNEQLTINSRSSLFKETIEKPTLVVASIFVVGLAIVGVYFVYRKRKEN